MIKLHGIALSNNVSKVRYCLNYLGLPYEWVQTNPLQGETQTKEYLQLSPSGKIPAIDIDGFKLFESNAINRYLATINDSPIYPQDPKQRAIVDAWSDFSSIHIGHATGRVFFNRVLASVFGAEKDENSEKAGVEFLQRFLPTVDERLSGSRYLAADQLTIADFNLLAILDPFEIMQFSLDPYPNIVKWRQQLMSQDWYRKCYTSYSEFVQSQLAQTE